VHFLNVKSASDFAGCWHILEKQIEMNSVPPHSLLHYDCHLHCMFIATDEWDERAKEYGFIRN